MRSVHSLPTRANFGKQNLFGFTLIELLVAITILAVLAAVGMTIYSKAQKAARMTKRIQDLHNIQSSLETYHTINGSYPDTSGNMRSECNNWGGQAANDVIPATTKFVPSYLKAFPSDPSMDKANSASCYIYVSDGKDYKLLDYNISEFSQADYQTQPNLIDPARDSVGGSCSQVELTAISGWSVYSNNTGIDDTANPACW